jgi:hypothetical protein
MGKVVEEVPVYLLSSVVSTDDEVAKQAIIDNWTDMLACKMARKSRVIVDADGNLRVEKYSARGGGHNRQIIEMLNDDGYIVKVFRSIKEASKYLGVSEEVINRTLKGERKIPIKPGHSIRRRETASERRKRERTTERAKKIRAKNKKKNGKK